jgi:uncharacterized OB-fold protein
MREFMSHRFEGMTRTPIRPTEFSKPFWEATRERRLLLQYCPRAKAYQFYPRPVSVFSARRDLEWREVSGHGHVYTYTVARVGPGNFKNRVPYVVALIELDEGVRIVSNLVNIDPTDVQIGLPVVPFWEPMSDGTHLLLFEPAHAQVNLAEQRDITR